MPKPQSDDPREELKKRAISLNLPTPIYTICPTAIKNAKTAVFAKVKVCMNCAMKCSALEFFYTVSIASIKL